MKNVTMTVIVNVSVPDDVDTNSLYLHMEPTDFTIGDGKGVVVDAEVTGFATESVDEHKDD